MAIALLATASCTTVRKSAETTAIQANVQQYPTMADRILGMGDIVSLVEKAVVADLDVKAKVTASVTWRGRLIKKLEPKKDLMKGNLIAETLEKADADVLLEPQTIFSKTGYLGERKITITGFPAKYKNFRKATPADLEALKVNAPAAECTVHNVSQKGLFGFGKKK